MEEGSVQAVAPTTPLSHVPLQAVALAPAFVPNPTIAVILEGG
jgi:hypothetical protein